MADKNEQTDVTVTFTADQLGALRALLRLVHYDNLAQDWFNLLPAEICQAVQGR
ncbi:hypothetical protein ACFYUR_19020 [Micromonospora haikouensis]|uniref:hypothetical protein n=1 Tax=Micromonospora haikouensis TaxID=686309 RepID=UPI0036BEA827